MDAQEKAKGFAVIAKAAIDDERLTHADRRVLMALGYHTDEHGICWPSGNTLAKKARTSPNHVWRCLKKLKRLGYVSVKVRGSRGGTNLYTVHGIAIGTTTVATNSPTTVLTVGTATVLQTPKRNTHKNTTTDGPPQQAASALVSFNANVAWFSDNAWSADRVDDLPAVVTRCWDLAGEADFKPKQLIEDLSRWASANPEKARRIRNVGAFYVKRFEEKAKAVVRRDAAVGGLNETF